MFIAMAAGGGLLVLAGIVGLVALTASLKGVAAAAIGVGLFCLYVGIRSIRKYNAIVRRRSAGE